MWQVRALRPRHTGRFDQGNQGKSGISGGLRIPAFLSPAGRWLLAPPPHLPASARSTSALNPDRVYGIFPISPLHAIDREPARCQNRAIHAFQPRRRSIMKGDKKVVEYLNKALKNELTAINQYFLHARMYENWGFNALNEHVYHESVDEMKHADALVKRILFLEGLPGMQDLGKLKIGENVTEMLKCDLDLEMEAVPLLREAIAYCETSQDYVSRELFEDILTNEEEHIDWLETQLELIGKVGEENYLQSKM
jgi:bacterioferritin